MMPQDSLHDGSTGQEKSEALLSCVPAFQGQLYVHRLPNAPSSRHFSPMKVWAIGAKYNVSSLTTFLWFFMRKFYQAI